MAVADFRRRLRFEERGAETDELGNEVTGDFASRFVRWVELKPLRGGEQVLASRLAGVQPVLIRVRRDSDTLDIAPDWRAVDVHDGTVYALHSVADMEQRNRDLTIMAEAGVAA